MVALSEVKNMFWGLTLDGGKRYTQTVHIGFHISMAALEMVSEKNSDAQHVAVMLQHEKSDFLLCTLVRGKVMQQPLDLNFNDGEEVTFFLNGKGVVHLTGYLMSEDDDDDMGMSEEDSDEEVPQLRPMKRGFTDSDEDSEDDDADETPNGKRKKKQKMKEIQKKARMFEESSDEDEDEDDSEDDDMYGDFIDDEAEEDSDEDSDDDDSFLDDDSDDSEMMEKLARMSGGITLAKQKTPKSKDTPSGKDKKAKQTPTVEGNANAKKTPSKKNAGTPDKANKDTPKKGNKDTPKKGNKDTPKKGNKDTPAKKVLDTPVAQRLETPQATSSKKKKNKKDKSTPAAASPTANAKASHATTPTATDSSAGEPKKKKKKKKKKSSDMQGEREGQTVAQQGKSTPAGAPSSTPKAVKRVLEGGVICEEKKEGHGPAAKTGKTVHVYYTGRLQNGKVFDSATSGKPFKFKLGKNEVITGWDRGLDGMKVGSKRKLTIPPKMAYGTQKMGDIPANSTLVFDVEMKAVS